MKKIIFRVDAGSKVGFGHLNRCLILAEEFNKKKYKIIFLLSKSSKPFIKKIKLLKFKFYFLDLTLRKKKIYNQIEDSRLSIKKLIKLKEVEYIFVDNYLLDYQWEKEISPYTKKIFVIDDFENRKHFCDFYLNSNFLLKKNRIKKNLLKPNTKILTEKKYFLINKIYRNIKTYKKRNFPLNFFVFFGMEDSKNYSFRTLKWISNKKLPGNYLFILNTSLKESLKKNKKFYSNRNFKFYKIQKNLYKILKKVDAMIGSGGSINLERILLKLPGIIFKVSDNQKTNCEIIKKFQLGHYKGSFENINQKKFYNIYNNFSKNFNKYKNFHNFRIDANGAKRVVSLL